MGSAAAQSIYLPFQLRDRNVILIPYSRDFTQLSVFEDRICLTEKLINQHRHLITTFSLSRFASILLDYRIDLRWNLLISQVF